MQYINVWNVFLENIHLTDHCIVGYLICAKYMRACKCMLLFSILRLVSLIFSALSHYVIE